MEKMLTEYLYSPTQKWTFLDLFISKNIQVVSEKNYKMNKSFPSMEYSYDCSDVFISHNKCGNSTND